MSARAHDQQLGLVIGGDPAQAVGDDVVERHHYVRVVDATVAQQSLDALPRLGARLVDLRRLGHHRILVRHRGRGRDDGAICARDGGAAGGKRTGRRDVRDHEFPAEPHRQVGRDAQPRACVGVVYVNSAHERRSHTRPTTRDRTTSAGVSQMT